MAGATLDDFAPKEWNVIFYRSSPSRLVRLLAVGTFKHVSALGYVSGTDMWVHVNVSMGRMTVNVFPNSMLDRIMGPLTLNTDVLIFEPEKSDLKLRVRAGWWCVPTVAQLLGIRSCALRPDRLYRQCLNHGAQIIVKGGQENADGPPKRSCLGAATGGG